MSAGEVFERGTSVVLKLVTTALWVVIGIGGFSAGAPLVGVGAIAYLVYIWVFGGRWLIY